MREVCKKCGKKRGDSNNATITQWLTTCRCKITDSSQLEDLEPLICPSCGKRTSEARAGTLTQWIFKAGSCQCSRRALDDSKQNDRGVALARAAGTNSLTASREEEDETELKIDPRLLPLSRYKPIAQLGSGAAADIYLCRDKLLKKKVAVKTLRMATESQTIAFQTEAKATSGLSHPNIVKVLDFGVSEGGAPYMVLDYTQGTSLDHALKDNGAMDWRDAVELAIHICDALGYAHKSGIFHRDLKPANVLISETDQGLSAQLIDFGLAKVIGQARSTANDASSSAISDGTVIVGTPAYMSPDQSAGLTYDARSEIYSLGCLLFECITGRPPFLAASSIELLALHTREEPPLLSQLAKGADAPERLEKIIKKCLQKDPAGRYQSMAELQSALEELLLQATSDEDDSEALTFSRITPLEGAGYNAGHFNPFRLLVILCAVASCVVIVYCFSNLLNIEARNQPDTMNASSRDPSLETPMLGEWTKIPWSDGISWWKKFNVDDESLRREVDVISKLDYLSLYSEPITAKGLSYIAHIPLKGLELRRTEIGDDAMPIIASMKTLEVLDVGRDPKLHARSLVYLRSLKNLKTLRLRGDEFSDDDLKYISNLASLELLELKYVPINGRGLIHLKNLSHLRKLDLGFTNIRNENLVYLRDLKALEELCLYNTKVSDSGMPNLNFTSIKTLDISGSGVSADGILKLKSMSGLRKLYLGDRADRGRIKNLTRGWDCSVLFDTLDDRSENMHVIRSDKF